MIFKKSILSLFILLPFIGLAQLKLSTSLQGGYEYNIFKNPDSLQRSQEINQDLLLQSAYFSAMGLDTDWKKRWKKHELRLETEANTQYFPTFNTANLLQMDATQGYSYKLFKKIKLYQKTNFRTKNRGGNNAADEVFALPNSYRFAELLAGFEWKANKQWKLKVELARLQRIYSETETSALRYRQKSLKLYTRYRPKNESKLASMEWTGRWRNRWYTRERFVDLDTEDWDEADWEAFEEAEFWDENIEEHDMTYWYKQLALKFDLDDNWSVKPSLDYTIRHSFENANLRFRQIRPALGLVYETDKTTFKTSISYTHRLNTDLIPSKAETALVYEYLRLTCSIEQQLAKRLDLIAGINATKRMSNFEGLTSRAYRSYNYFRVLLGLKYNF